MFIIDDILAAAWPAISQIGSTAMGVANGVNAITSAMGGKKSGGSSSGEAPSSSGDIDIGNLDSITNAISASPIPIMNQVKEGQDAYGAQVDKGSNEMMDGLFQMSNAEEKNLISSYYKGGIPNDGKPAVIYDMRTGKPTGTMNEKGPEYIVPAYDGEGNMSLVDSIGGALGMGTTATSPKMAEQRPLGTFMGMGDFGETMRSMLTLAANYNDAKRAEHGLPKSGVSDWLKWQDTQDKNAMVMALNKKKLAAQEKNDDDKIYNTARDDVFAQYKAIGLDIDLNDPEVKAMFQEDVQNEYTRRKNPNAKLSEPEMITTRGTAKKHLFKDDEYNPEVYDPRTYKVKIMKAKREAIARDEEFNDAYLEKYYPNLVPLKQLAKKK